MTKTVTKITSAIKKLPPNEFSEFSEWFTEFEAQVWDKKIENDLQNGKLQSFINKAEEDFLEGKCQPL
ncbi:MAG: hypothetical protein ACR2J3_03615 [Aridibacter sp.]